MMFTTISLLIIAGQFTFETPVRIEADGKPIDVTTGHAAPYVYDFDGDGVRDLLVGEFGSGEFTGPVHMNVEGAHKWSNGRLRFYKNYGTDYDMTLSHWEYVKAGGEIAVVPITCCVSFVPHFVDYDNDGDDDILSASYPGDMYLFPGNGDGTYEKPIHLQNEDGEPLLAWRFLDNRYRGRAGTDRQTIHSTTAELHDMDADGDLDLVIGSRLDGCHTIENIGTRSEPIWSNTSKLFRDHKGDAIGGWDWGSNVHWHDWDMDGISDVIVGAEDGGVRWYRNVGEENIPTFGDPVLLIPSQTTDEMFARLEEPVRAASRCKVHATDWDGDGVTDLLVGDFGSSWKHVKTRTPEEEKEVESLKTKNSELGKLAMPLWNMDRDLTEGEKQEMGRLDQLMQKNYERQEELETHRQSSHGWVWLYKQTQEPLAEKQTPHVNISMKKSSMIQAGKPFILSVTFEIDNGWSIGSASMDTEGLPTTIDIEVPEGFSITQVDWPTLNTQSGKLGYRGQIEVDVELEAPSTLPEGEIPFEMEANWQVCSDRTGICVRGNATLHASMQ